MRNLRHFWLFKSEGQAVLGRQSLVSTPWLTERHGYDPTWRFYFSLKATGAFTYPIAQAHFAFVGADVVRQM